MSETNGYTKTPNWVYDYAIPLLNRNRAFAAVSVLDFVVRQTIGWGRERVKLSVSDIEKGTELSRQGVQNSLDTLRSLGLIERRKIKNTFEYSLVTPEGLAGEDRSTPLHDSPRNHATLLNESCNSVARSQKELESDRATLLNENMQRSRTVSCNSVARSDPQNVDTEGDSSGLKKIKENKEILSLYLSQEGEREGVNQAEKPEGENPYSGAEPGKQSSPVPVQPQASSTDTQETPIGAEVPPAPAADEWPWDVAAHQWHCHKAPWLDESGEFKEEMIQAVVEAHSGCSFVRTGTGRRNDTAIKKHLRSQVNLAKKSYHPGPGGEAIEDARKYLRDLWSDALKSIKQREESERLRAGAAIEQPSSDKVVPLPVKPPEPTPEERAERAARFAKLKEMAAAAAQQHTQQKTKNPQQQEALINAG